MYNTCRAPQHSQALSRCIVHIEALFWWRMRHSLRRPAMREGCCKRVMVDSSRDCVDCMSSAGHVHSPIYADTSDAHSQKPPPVLTYRTSVRVVDHLWCLLTCFGCLNDLRWLSRAWLQHGLQLVLLAPLVEYLAQPARLRTIRIERVCRDRGAKEATAGGCIYAYAVVK